MDTPGIREINMLNTLRIKSLRGAPLKGVLAACLLAGSGAEIGRAHV